MVPDVVLRELRTGLTLGLIGFHTLLAVILFSCMARGEADCVNEEEPVDALDVTAFGRLAMEIMVARRLVPNFLPALTFRLRGSLSRARSGILAVGRAGSRNEEVWRGSPGNPTLTQETYDTRHVTRGH